MAGLPRQRAGAGWAAGVLACTGTGLLADAGVLAACFGLAGLPVPWRGLLFAYAAGQLAGRLVPLPGGIGGVEGGMLGALTLTGTPPPRPPRSSSTGWPGAGPSAPPGPRSSSASPAAKQHPGPVGDAAVTVPGRPVHPAPADRRSVPCRHRKEPHPSPHRDACQVLLGNICR